MNDLMDKIKNLRESSGAGFMDCKKALQENNGDIEKSIIYLRKKGLAKAVKKSDRETNEGAVGIYSNDLKSLILEINTETDFAAKNVTFLDFFDQIGNIALNIDNHDITIENFLNFSHKDKKISDYLTELISKIGENIVIKRVSFLKKEKNTEIFEYVHNAYRANIGKIAVILKAEVKELNDEVKKFGKNLCMHIAASKPIAFDQDNLEDSIIKNEKEVQLSMIKSSGKPDNIIEKILDGKMKKFFSEVTLINQPFILDPDKNIKETISEFSTNNYFQIIKYNFFVLGL